MSIRNNGFVVTILPNMKSEEHYSMEELGHDGKITAMKGATAADEREMDRMGKAQELRVGVPC